MSTKTQDCPVRGTNKLVSGKKPWRSARYPILPRVRKLAGYGNVPLYVCTWKDPGNLVQTEGEPLRYEWLVVGVGATPDEAIAMCQKKYLAYTTVRDSCSSGYRPQRLEDTGHDKLFMSDLPSGAAVKEFIIGLAIGALGSLAYFLIQRW